VKNVAAKNVSLSGNVVTAAMLAGRRLADERFRQLGIVDGAAEMPLTEPEARGMATGLVKTSDDDLVAVVAALVLRGARQKWAELRGS
jgi:hypothetical protein